MRKWLVLSLLFLGACGSGGFDPNLAAHQAQQQAEYYAMLATGTAQAQIVPITQTAGAMEALQTQGAATAQAGIITQQAGITQTAMSWTPTPVPTATQDLPATAQKVQLDAQIKQTALDLEKQEQSNYFWSIVPGLTFALVAGALIMFLIFISRRERYRPAQVDGRGNILPMFDFVEGTATDLDNMPNYRGDLHDSLGKMFLELLRKRLQLNPQLPEVTAPRQDLVKQRDQLIDITTRGLPAGSKAEGRKQASQEMAMLPAPPHENRFKILPEGAHDLEILDGVVIEVLDQDWKEAEKK